MSGDIVIEEELIDLNVVELEDYERLESVILEEDSVNDADESEQHRFWSIQLLSFIGQTVPTVVIPTTGGGFLVNAEFDFYMGLIKFDEHSKITWSKSYIYPGCNSFRSHRFIAIRETELGDFFVVSSILPAGSDTNDDILLLRINPSGELVWQKRYGGPDAGTGTGIALTRRGDILVCGRSILWCFGVRPCAGGEPRR